MLVDAPAAGSKPKSAITNRREAERAVAVAERDIDAGVAEADDVGAAVAGDVGEEARMLVDPPAAGSKPKSVMTGTGVKCERAVAVAERDVHAGVAEADDVGAAVAGQVGEEARMLVDAPAAGFEPEVGQHETAVAGTCRRRCRARRRRRRRRSRRCRRGRRR